MELGFLTAKKNGGKRWHFSPRGLCAPGPAAGDGGGSGWEGKALLREGGMRQESAWSEETGTKGATVSPQKHGLGVIHYSISELNKSMSQPFLAASIGKNWQDWEEESCPAAGG